MKSLAIWRYAFSLTVAMALLGGCGGAQSTISVPGAMPQVQMLTARTATTSYKVLYNFAGGSDGANPVAALIDVGGTLYGTTIAGGKYSSGNKPCYGWYGYHIHCGTVFSVTLDGSEKVLHSFGAGIDGANPQAGLVDVGGTLYGTTFEGGGIYCYYADSCGTVFSITPSGKEKVLYAFAVREGANPAAGLIALKGTLYGTTLFGGENGCYASYPSVCGTVFSIKTAGGEIVLHRFHTAREGGQPYAGLLDVKGKLYGTTSAYGERRPSYGTVFRLALGGGEKVLHRFGGYPNDGAHPYTGLIDEGGTLYGTTNAGGASLNGGGTVFSVTLGGTEKVLHSTVTAPMVRLPGHPSSS